MVLLTINLFNYIDRYILAAVLPKLEVAFLADDPLAKTKLGALTTAFLVSYMVLSPLFGWLGDRMSRWLLVAVGVILWSLASGASGLAGSFWILLATRCFVGVGEAAYGPVAPTVISDLYPIKIRGSVLAWFYAAIPVGSALGYVLGGVVAGSIGWRWAFYLVVPPGLLLGLWCLRMREPSRGQADTGQAAPARTARFKDYLTLRAIPSYVLQTVGSTAMTFAVGGIAVWMPTYIYEREGRFELTEQVWHALQEGPGAVAESVLVQLQPLRDKVYNLRDFKGELKERIPGTNLSPAEQERARTHSRCGLHPEPWPDQYDFRRHHGRVRVGGHTAGRHGRRPAARPVSGILLPRFRRQYADRFSRDLAGPQGPLSC